MGFGYCPHEPQEGHCPSHPSHARLHEPLPAASAAVSSLSDSADLYGVSLDVVYNANKLQLEDADQNPAFAGLDGQVPSTPGWYVGAYAFNVGNFTSSIDHFSSVAAGTITSAAASGSSGFGGGGFSGGGGGGGGGGSW